jgi:ADP-heptose:LPS heptosyltransferase
MKILIYNSGGGLGDSIQLFNLVNSLNLKYENCQMWYLGAHENHFQNSLKEYNIETKTYDLGLKYFGFRWRHLFQIKDKIKENLNINFDLIIDLQSKFRNTFILKKIKTKIFYSSTLNFLFSSEKKDYISTKNNIDDILLNLEKILKTNIPLINYDIKKIDQKFFNEASKLLPGNNYIGFSITQGNIYRKKTWPLEKFINVANSLNNHVPVFFIEKNNTKLIKEISSKVKKAIFPETNTLLSCPALITALSTRLEKAITIDNGIMHMMGLANIPMITLFGPTNSDKFAPKKRNVIILDSKKLYDSNDISKITETDVLREI